MQRGPLQSAQAKVMTGLELNLFCHAELQWRARPFSSRNSAPTQVRVSATIGNATLYSAAKRETICGVICGASDQSIEEGRKMRKRVWVIAALVVVGVVAGSVTAVYAFSDSGGSSGAISEATVTAQISDTKCVLKAMDLAVHSENTTSSTTYTGVTGAIVRFNQGGSTPDCIEVNFSSMAFAAGASTTPGFDRVIEVRALLDGTSLAPGETQFSGDDDEDADFMYARSHAFTWVADAVAPGPHIVRIQFRSHFGGDVFLHRGVTTVFHG
jgi:hypothetical protein